MKDDPSLRKVVLGPQPLSGTGPGRFEDIGIDAVKDAVKSAAADAGKKVGLKNISIVNENEVLEKLKK